MSTSTTVAAPAVITSFVGYVHADPTRMDVVRDYVKTRAMSYIGRGRFDVGGRFAATSIELDRLAAAYTDPTTIALGRMMAVVAHLTDGDHALSYEQRSAAYAIATSFTVDTDYVNGMVARFAPSAKRTTSNGPATDRRASSERRTPDVPNVIQLAYDVAFTDYPVGTVLTVSEIVAAYVKSVTDHPDRRPNGVGADYVPGVGAVSARLRVPDDKCTLVGYAIDRSRGALGARKTA